MVLQINKPSTDLSQRSDSTCHPQCVLWHSAVRFAPQRWGQQVPPHNADVDQRGSAAYQDRLKDQPSALTSSDIVSARKRSEMMRAVRRTGTPAEIQVGLILKAGGVRYRRNNRSLPGSPDLSNRARGWAIFVHGCFWHGHADCSKTKGGPHGRIPLSNAGFWAPKIATNRDRDRRKAAELRAMDLRVLTVWECELKNPARLARRLRRFFDQEGTSAKG